MAKESTIGLETILIIIQVMLFSVLFPVIPKGEIKDSSPNNQAMASEARPTTSKIKDTDFNKAIPHILKWEGQCSDHYADRGGRTFKGITTGVARKHGYRGDVCKMTHDQVMEIYYKDYWARVPRNIEYAEKLAWFNMIVNGTSNSCLQRAKQAGNNAISMLNCQQVYYDSLSARNRKYFGNGWRNRNNYFLNVVRELN